MVRHSRTAIVVTGGVPVDSGLAAQLPQSDLVIAADAGLHAAHRLGLRVDLLVGDLDSVDATAVPDDLAVERHPADKDHTDLALALRSAIARDARRVVVVSGGGGRLDHSLGNLLVLASPDYAALTVDAHIGDATVTVVRGERHMTAPVGTVVSLFAVGGPASGVTTAGLRYVLDDAVLEPLSSRGVSNVFAQPTASVRVDAGVVLAVRPGAEDAS